MTSSTPKLQNICHHQGPLQSEKEATSFVAAVSVISSTASHSRQVADAKEINVMLNNIIITETAKDFDIIIIIS